MSEGKSTAFFKLTCPFCVPIMVLCIKEVKMKPIDYKFVMMLSSRIEGFAVKSTNPLKVNCRCVVCGDSQKSKTKKRGWFTEYKGGVRYGCFNCGASLWLSDYLKEYEPSIYDDYIMEGKLEWMREKGFIDATSLDKPQTKFTINKNQFKVLKKISSLPHTHPAKKYVEKRKIPSNKHFRLFYVDKFNKFVNGIIPNKLSDQNDEPRLVIPFLDENKNMIGFSGRSFGSTGLRYITIMLDSDKPKIFGLDQIDKNKTVYVTEGPIDSLFLDNAVAMAGTGANYDFKDAVYIYDCEPRNVEIVKHMSNTIKRGDKIVIWPEKMAKYGKDINDAIMNGLTKEQVSSIIRKNTYQGLMAELKLTEWRKC